MAKPALEPAQVLTFRRIGERPVSPVEIAVSAGARSVAPITSTPAADLAGNAPFVFLIGAGNTGKTTVARYIIERAHTAGRQAMLAAMDPINRSLTQYFDGVEQPQTSEPAESANFLRELLTFSMSGKHPSIVDTGAGDTSLGAVYAEMPDLETDLAAVGIAPVALYTLSERIDDLGPFLKLRFQPKATAFICNLGLTSSGPDAFRTSLEQPAVREAIEVGARVIYMPYLDRVVVKQIELERMSFGDASKKLAGVQSMQVRAWLRAMDTALGGVASWLP